MHLVTTQPQSHSHSTQDASHGQLLRPSQTPSEADAPSQAAQTANLSGDLGQQAIQQPQLPLHVQQHFQHLQTLQAQIAAQLGNLTAHPIMQAPTQQPGGPPHVNATSQQILVQYPQVGYPNGLTAQNGLPHQTHPVPTSNNERSPQTPQAIPQPFMNAAYQEHVGPNGQRFLTRTETMNVTSHFHVNQPPHAHMQDPLVGQPNSQNTQSPSTSHNLPASRDPPHEISTPLRAPDLPETTALYLLSSPTGQPHALLVSPAGRYTTPWPVPSLSFTSSPMFAGTAPNPSIVTSASSTQASSGQGFNHASPARSPIPNANAQQAPHVQALPVPAQAANNNAIAIQPQQQQHEQQRRDIARIVLPLAGHLWLLIRLFGFVYFFTHGASFMRTMILCSIATLVFLAQLGFFRGIWEPLRRHADSLFALGGNEQANPQARRDDVNVGAAQDRRRHTVAQEAGRNSALEGYQQNGGLVRQVISRAERATALFLASLAPGVAERHIQAREAAEAARQRETREREERETRQADEAKQAQEAEAAASLTAPAAVTAGETRSSSSGNGSQSGPQPPLIEV